MKNFILTMVLSSLVTSAFAQSRTPSFSSLTCMDQYTHEAAVAKAKRDRYNYKFNRERGSLSINGGLSLAGFMAGLVTGSIPVVLVGVLTPKAISAIKNIPNKEERALRLAEETSRQLRRYVKKMQRRVSSDVTSDEVVRLLNKGFESGDFCKDPANLAGPVQMRKYVENELKLKYFADPAKSVAKAIVRLDGVGAVPCFDDQSKD